MDNKINGRTPEEIKFGLKCCAYTGACQECVYAERCKEVAEEDDRLWFGEPVMRDALAYIQKLEAEIKHCYVITKDVSKHIKNSIEHAERMDAIIQRLKHDM